MGTNLTGGVIPGAKRIDGACWIDGCDDHLIIEFWAFSGSIARTCYNRRTGSHKLEFLAVGSEPYRRMLPMAQAALESAWYSI